MLVRVGRYHPDGIKALLDPLTCWVATHETNSHGRRHYSDKILAAWPIILFTYNVGSNTPQMVALGRPLSLLVVLVLGLVHGSNACVLFSAQLSDSSPIAF